MRYYTILENGWRLETNIPWNQIKVEKWIIYWKVNIKIVKVLEIVLF
jgi:hypothetical protein